MDPVKIFFFFCALTLCGMAALPAYKQKSLLRFFLGVILSFFGVLLPLVFFFLSAALIPDSKQNSHHGWLDCFYFGKLALTPFVLWATLALYAVEIYRTPDRTRPCIVLGFFIGAITSTLCAIYGIFTCERDSLVLLIVPIYTAIWYVVRAAILIRAAKPSLTSLLFTFASSLPFWAVGIFWSYAKYLSLPDQATGCFVVTAASRGHRNFVGPFLTVSRRGQPRFANQQLATFWELESFWRSHSPRSHAMFRSVYNKIGPVIARNISTPFLADVIFLALKPAELCARSLLDLRNFSANSPFQNHEH
jgi:hypothetical protein